MNVFERLAHPWWTLALFFGLTIAAIAVMEYQVAPLRQLSPRGVGDLELAGTKECADLVLAMWGENGKRIATTNILLDFLFIPCYTTLLALIWFFLASKTRSIRPLSLLLTFWAWLMWFAGILDVVENLCMLAMLTHGTSDLLARLSQVCATTKFIITVVLMKVLFKKGACG